jgi:hypothetical protein
LPLRHLSRGYERGRSAVSQPWGRRLLRAIELLGTRVAPAPRTGASSFLKGRLRYIQMESGRVVSECVEPLPGASEYEQLVGLASRVDQLLRELEAWLHARERAASTGGARERQYDWRRRRLAILRHSQALLAALLRDVEV